MQVILERLKNCQFGVVECTYLGHVIRGGKVQVDKAKVEAVAKFQTPKKKEMMTNKMRVAILGDNTIFQNMHLIASIMFAHEQFIN